MMTSNEPKDTSVQEENCSLDRLCMEEKNEVLIKISSSIAKGTFIPSLVVLDIEGETNNANVCPPEIFSLRQETLCVPSVAVLDVEDETCKTNAYPLKTTSLPQGALNKVASRKIFSQLTTLNIQAHAILLKKELTNDGRHVGWNFLESVISASGVVGLTDVTNIDGGEERTAALHRAYHSNENFGDIKCAEVNSKHTTVLSNPTEDSTHRDNSLTTNSLTLTTSPEQRQSRTIWLLSRSYKFVSKILTKPIMTEKKQLWLCHLREPENDERSMEMVFFERFRSKKKPTAPA